MDKQEYRKNAGDMLYLAACAVNGRAPSAGRVSRMDLGSVYAVCEDHSLTAIADYALEAVGVKDRDFVQSKEKAVRKNILLDAERSAILRRFEEEGIWYMPLKGILLKDWYPKLGMRQMSDNDILFDPEKRERVREIMENSGFFCEHFGKGTDDGYHKEPVSNFEMHVMLFSTKHDEALVQYYGNVKERLIKDSGNKFGYHFTDEDYYIYLIAHEYKHYVTSGTGVRSLLDIYVYMNRFSESLDWEYINGELRKLGIDDFEFESRQLAMKLFSFEKLTVKEKKRLDYYVTSGVYGSLENKVNNKAKKNGTRAGYVFRRLFPTMGFIKSQYPFYYKHKYLIPVLWVKRIFKAIFVDRKRIESEIKYLSE